MGPSRGRATNVLIGALSGGLICLGFVGVHYWRRPWDFADDDLQTIALFLVILFAGPGAALGAVMQPGPLRK